MGKGVESGKDESEVKALCKIIHTNISTQTIVSRFTT